MVTQMSNNKMNLTNVFVTITLAKKGILHNILGLLLKKVEFLW